MRVVHPESAIERTSVLSGETNYLTTPKRDVGAALAENNMAVVCMDDQDVTRACQSSDYQYFCTSTGQLRRNGAYSDHVCEEECVCVNLRPKPNCIMWINGMSSCLRKRDEGMALAENNMAVVCMDDLEITKACQSSDFQYYCTSGGELKRNGAFVHKVCQEECRCVNLKPKANCIFWVNGMSSCLRTRDEVEAMTGSPLTLTKSLPSPTETSVLDHGFVAEDLASEGHDRFLPEGRTPIPESTHEQAISHGTEDLQEGSIHSYGNPYNNYALVCSDNRGFTYKCQSRHGYFCTKDGLLAHRPKTGKADEDCLDFCGCLNLYP